MIILAGILIKEMTSCDTHLLIFNEYGHTHTRQAGRQAGRWKGRQADRRAGRQVGRQAGRQAKC